MIRSSSLFSLLLTFSLTFGLAACGPTNRSEPVRQPATYVPPDVKAEEEIPASETPSAGVEKEETSPTESPSEKPQGGETVDQPGRELPTPLPEEPRGERDELDVDDDGNGEGDVSQKPDPQNTQGTLLMAVVHFGFDQSRLRPEGRRLLDQLLKSLANVDEIARIRVTGYSDRLGTDSHNVRLSKRRALAVQEYLLERSKTLMPSPLKAMLIEIVVKAGAEPTASCPSDATRDEQIACLEADRRAEVEVEVSVPTTLNAPN